MKGCFDTADAMVEQHLSLLLQHFADFPLIFQYLESLHIVYHNDVLVILKGRLIKLNFSKIFLIMSKKG